MNMCAILNVTYLTAFLSTFHMHFSPGLKLTIGGLYIMLVCFVEVGAWKAVTLFYRLKWNYIYICTMKVCDISPFAVLLFFVYASLDVT